MATLTLRPSSDIDLKHQCSTGSNGYAMISETTADDDSTYIYQTISSTTTEESVTSTFAMTATMPTSAFIINNATIHIRGKSGTSGTFSGTYQLSTDNATSNLTLGTTDYADTTNTVLSNLVGNRYTSSSFPPISVTITTNGKLNAGMIGKTPDPVNINITQVYLDIEYEIDNTYNIEYTLNGGTEGNPAPDSGTKGTYINIANPTKSGYTFDGWNITGLDDETHYHGNSRPSYGNIGATSATGTSISGVKSTWFNLQALDTVTFTAIWTENQTGGDDLSGIILRPVSDTTLGHMCSNGTAGYPMISETTADDDTTYIYQQITAATNTSATSTFALDGTLPSGQFKIIDATICIRAKGDSSITASGTYQLSIDDATSAITLGTTAYQNTTNSNVCSNLIGSTYTSSNFPNISVTITTTGRTSSTTGGKSSTTSEIHITQVYLQLEYEEVEDTTYSIVYALNGGSNGSPAPTNGTKGTYVNIANPTRSGYTFNGWNITGLTSGTHYHGNSKPSSGNSGATSVSGTSISGTKSTWFNLQTTGTVTFTATWEIIPTVVTYIISYNYDGGTKGTYAPTTANVDAYVQISNPTKNGYTFKGWSISGMNPTTAKRCYYGSSTADSNNQSTTLTALSGITAIYFKNLRTSAGTVTFTATWEAIPTTISYNITYNYDGGTKGTNAPTTASVDSYVQISHPTKGGYTFKGWNITGMNPTSSKKCYYGFSSTDSSNTSTTSTSLSSITATYFKNLRTSTGTVTFTAVWEKVNGIYIKENGSWVQYAKAYKKINGVWVEQSDLSTLFNSNTNYVKGN